MSDAGAPRILSAATAVPPHRVDQDRVRDLTRALFARGFRDIDRLIAVFDHGQVSTRYLAAPLEWFETEHAWPEKNALYAECAVNLGERAAADALHRARVDARDVRAIVFVSTTGIATPSLDATLIKRLGLSRHVTRVPVWGLGCAAGAAGLNRAADLARVRPDGVVLLVAAELCSLTFQRDDLSKSNLVAASLFADGAAAVVVGPGEGPALTGAFSTLWDDTEDVMGWDVNDAGLKVRFSRDVPSIVRDLMRDNLSAAAAANDARLEDFQHFVAHPGGVKVLRAFADALDLRDGALDDSYAVLAEYGNMSSASVLFVLERFLRRWPELPGGERGVISAMGPGFSAEHAIFTT